MQMEQNKGDLVVEIVALLLIIAIVFLIAGPMIVSWFYPAHSCPAILIPANKTEVLGWINSTTSQYQLVRDCAVEAVEIYNSTGLLTQYNITLSAQVKAAIASNTQEYYLVEYGIPAAISIVIVLAYLFLKLRKPKMPK